MGANLRRQSLLKPLSVSGPHLQPADPSTVDPNPVFAACAASKSAQCRLVLGHVEIVAVCPNKGGVSQAGKKRNEYVSSVVAERYGLNPARQLRFVQLLPDSSLSQRTATAICGRC